MLQLRGQLPAGSWEHRTGPDQTLGLPICAGIPATGKRKELTVPSPIMAGQWQLAKGISDRLACHWAGPGLQLSIWLTSQVTPAQLQAGALSLRVSTVAVTVHSQLFACRWIAWTTWGCIWLQYKECG